MKKHVTIESIQHISDEDDVEVTITSEDDFDESVEKFKWMTQADRDVLADQARYILDAIEEAEFELKIEPLH